MSEKKVNKTLGKKKAFYSSKKASVRNVPKKASSVKKPVPMPAIQYVLPLGNGWVVKNNKTAKFLVITDSKREAISIGRNIARTKKTALIVHGRSGKIEVRENYQL